MEGEEKPKKETNHSRLADGRFNKQVNLHTRLVLGGFKTSRYLYLPTRILKVYRGLNWVQSHGLSRWSQHTTFSRLCSWKHFLLLQEQWAEHTLPGQGREWGTTDCSGPAPGPTGSHILLVTSSNTTLVISLMLRLLFEVFSNTMVKRTWSGLSWRNNQRDGHTL